MGKRFLLPCDDPWVRGTGDAPHAYLDGARKSWTDHPEYMDFLDLTSPINDLKRAEADLVIHHWQRHLDASSVLDVGCGIGRFATRWLDHDATVHGVDPDIESLRRLAWHAAGRSGRLDLHWSSAHVLPDVTVDLAIAAEVLCYVPDAVEALRRIAGRVRPGGAIALSVEARWGWAASQDAPLGSLDAALAGDGVIDVPGDRWVQTYTREGVEALASGAGLVLEELVASHWIPDGPLEDAAPSSLSLEELLALESRCAAHPVWGPLHRLWLATLRVPG